MKSQKFTFLHTPESLIELFREGKINAMEMVLLSRIGSFENCYASNQFFADFMRCSPLHISKCVSRFLEIGLIKVKYKQGQRRIRPLWVDWKGLKRSGITGEGGMQKSIGPYAKKHTHPMQKSIGHLSNRFENDKIDTTHRKGASSCSRSDPGIMEEQNGQSLKESNVGKMVNKFAKFTIENRHHVGKKGSTMQGWTPGTINQWRNKLADLCSQVGSSKEVRDVLGWYLEHFDDDYVPQRFTIPSFCLDYSQIKKAQARHHKEQGIEDESCGITIKVVKVN